MAPPNMTTGKDAGLLELLKTNASGADPLAALAAKTPAHDLGEPGGSPEAKLNEVIGRIMQLTGSDVRRSELKGNVPAESVARTVAEATTSATLGNSVSKSSATDRDAGIKDNCSFIPMNPPSIRETGLPDS